MTPVVSTRADPLTLPELNELRDRWRNQLPPAHPTMRLVATLDAIEAEVRGDIATKVAALPGMNGRNDAIDGALEVSRAAVLAAISSSDDTTQETQDGERLPVERISDEVHKADRDLFEKGRALLATPTPDDRDREVERIAAALLHATDGNERLIHPNLTLRSARTEAAAIVRYLDAGLRASGTDTSPGLASAGGTE